LQLINKYINIIPEGSTVQSITIPEGSTVQSITIPEGSTVQSITITEGSTVQSITIPEPVDFFKLCAHNSEFGLYTFDNKDGGSMLV
jgi:hypothetical protein